jgi:hypothetical protein
MYGLPIVFSVICHYFSIFFYFILFTAPALSPCIESSGECLPSEFNTNIVQFWFLLADNLVLITLLITARNHLNVCMVVRMISPDKWHILLHWVCFRSEEETPGPSTAWDLCWGFGRHRHLYY